MYVYGDEFQKSYLKDPFLVYYEMDSYYNSWRLEYLNGIPKYSLLIYKYDTASLCEDGRNENQWILLVLFHEKLVRITDIVLIWTQSVSITGNLEILCWFCDPCNPFKMIPMQIESVYADKHLLKKSTRNIKSEIINPQSVLILLHKVISRYKVLKRLNRWTIRAIMVSIKALKLSNDINKFPYLANIHIASLLFEINLQSYKFIVQRFSVFMSTFCTN